MCFSFQVSVGSFIVAWGISLYLLRKKLTMIQKQNVIFLMIFSLMQIPDAILWFIKMKKNKINYIVTSFLIPFLLCIQVFYRVFIVNKNTNILITLFFLCVFAYIFYRFNGYSISLCNNKFASPIWGTKEITIVEFFIFAIFITYPNINGFLIAIFVVYPLIHIFAGGAYGSLWCALGILLAFYYLYLY